MSAPSFGGLGIDLELLADPLRVRLLALLAQDELSVGELARALSAPQATVSRHLKALTDQMWLTRRTSGPQAWLRMAALAPQRQTLWQLVLEDAEKTQVLASDRARLTIILAERNTEAGTFFERVGEGWDRLRDQLFGRRFLLPTLATLAAYDRVVLDLGCGTGELLALLAPEAKSAIGIDREPSMIELAKRRLDAFARAKLYCAELEHLPVATGLADLALAILVLHHVAEPVQMLSEAKRVLAPSGRLVIVDMQPHQHSAYAAFGHQHQGFSRASLGAFAAQAGLFLRHYSELPTDPDAQGPPLFLATLTHTP